MSLYRLRIPLRHGLLLCGLTAFASTAQAHSTLAFNLSPPPGYALGGAGNLTELSTMIAMGTARLRSQNIEIDLTMADGAAYSLLSPDPYSAPTSNSTQPNSAETHFNQDHSLLVQRGATLFTLNQNGKALDLIALTVELTPAQDIVFHLKYPPASNAPLRLQLDCFDKTQPSQKAVLNILDAAGHSLALASLDANTPAIDVATTPTAATPVPTAKYSGIKIAAGLTAGGVALWLLLKLRQPPAKN